jgi:hypothetical protein
MSLAASSAAPGRTGTAGVIAVRRPGCAGRQQGSWRYLQQTVSDRVIPVGEGRYPIPAASGWGTDKSHLP